MKKTLIFVAMFGCTAASMASMNLSFTNGAASVSNEVTDVLSINTGTLDASSVGSMGDAVMLSGSSTVADSFTLTSTVGFGFQHDGTWTWDTTAHTADPAKNNINFRASGMAPNGTSGAKYSDGEIIWFEVGGLDDGNSVLIQQYILNGKAQDRVDFFYQQGAGSIQKIDSAPTPGDYGLGSTTLSVTLSDGDYFGWADNAGNTGARGELIGFEFDVIPEPATVGMLAFCGAGLWWIRRRIHACR